MDKPKRSRRGFVWVSILIACFFLYLSLRGLDWNVFVASISNANYGYIPLIFAWASINQWFRALRWRILLTAERPIPAVNVFWANMAGYLGNNILPARAGEWIRASYVSVENGLSFLFSLATGLVERLIDLIALVFLGMVALAVSGLLSKPIQDALKAMSIIAIMGVVVLLVLPYFGGRLRQILHSLPVLSVTVQEKLGNWVEQFLEGIAALHHPARAITFIILTALIWLLDGVGVILLAHALHLQFSLVEAFLLLAGLGLSSAIPSTPGYIGIYQLVAVVVLQPFGVSNSSAIAFIIFLQITSFLIVAFWGGFALWRTIYISKSKVLRNNDEH